jgi:beta-galactosidase
MNCRLILPIFAYLLFGYFTNAQTRLTTELLTDWKFQKGSNPDAFQKGFNDSEWRKINIPHDWAIEGPFIKNGDGNTGKLPWKDEAWYRRKINIPKEYLGKQIYLIFDGIMAFPQVYVNGTFVGKWDYGYNSFHLDITRFLQPGNDNILAIHVDTRQHDSRWYPGAGIYRKVQMLAVNPVHVDIWGTYITTPVLKPHYADIRIATSLSNRSNTNTEIRVEQAIFNAQQNEIVKGEVKAIVSAGKSETLENTLVLPNPRLWDITFPHLYSLRTRIYSGNVLLDEYTSSFGVREMHFAADKGFYLNNRRVQLKGVNLHHDLGPLGAAFNVRAMERQLEIMKDMGVNAIRTSHNTAAPELLELCDKMGLLVFNEIFDKYDNKAGILDTTDFESFAQRNIHNFVVRDRNHPSIFLWSVGNEIGDVQWNINNGFQRLQTMVNYVRKYDITRPVTLVCDNLKSAALRHFDYYDVHSWNYGRRYWLARQLEPNKPVIISESASTVSTRGFYEFPLPEKQTDFTKSRQVSSYDLNAPEWAEISDDDFMWQQEEPYIAGEFIWTGFDYIGEPTPYSNYAMKQFDMTEEQVSVSSYFGTVDLCGIPKDRYYLYKSYWKPDETTIHILPHWNWPDRSGQITPVFVYTNGDCAELFLNGKSMGMQCKKPKSEKSIERFRLMWMDMKYEPGELKAVAYKEGKIIGEKIMKTAGQATQLRLTPDRNTIQANGKDLSYILIEALDKDGNLYPLADHQIEIKLTGPGKIAGVCNGNPQSMEPFQANTVKLFHGKAMLGVGMGATKGNLKVEANSKGLSGAVLSIKTE